MLNSVLLSLSLDTNLVIEIPELNQTEYSTVQQDLTATPALQYIDYLNSSKIIMDKTLTDLNQSMQYYTRTHYQDFECLTQEGDYVSTVPDLSIFTLVSTNELLDGQSSTHFRYNSYYEADNTVDNAEVFNSNQTYQQDFWCRDQIVNQQTICVPVRYEVHGRSQYGSHQSYYLTQYYNFTTELDNSLFVVDTICQTSLSTKKQAKQFVHHLLAQMVEKATIEENLNIIAKIQQNKNLTFTVGPNQFINFNKQQRKAMLSRKAKQYINKNVKGSTDRPDIDLENCTYPEDTVLPDQLNVADFPYHVHVRDQAWGGSCWVNSWATSLADRVNKILYEQNQDYQQVDFSVQSGVDCYWNESFSDPDWNNNGVEGGLSSNAFWMLKNTFNGKIAQTKDYPYLGQNDYCKTELMTYPVNVDKACQILFDIDNTKRALYLGGSVSVSINVPDSFTYYTGGIYNDPACLSDYGDLEHAVTLVGYGIDYSHGSEMPYWIIQNSWSQNWGNNGYIYIEMSDANICGILTDVSYVELSLN